MPDLTPHTRIVGAEITRSRRLLEMFNASTRNKLIRDSMTVAGEKWRAKYVPMRFTDYVRKAPFNYKLTTGAAWKRMQAPGGVFDRMSARFDGSNPFPSEGEPRIVFGQAYQKWLEDQQKAGRYRSSNTGDWVRAKVEYRARLGVIFRDAAKSWYTDNAKTAPPLFMTGKLAQAVMTGRVTSRATANMASCTITLPRLDRQNPWARRILGTVPIAEVKQFAAWFMETVTAQGDAAALALVRARIASTAARIQAKAAKMEARIDANERKAVAKALAKERKAAARALARDRRREGSAIIRQAFARAAALERAEARAARQRSTSRRPPRVAT